MAEEAKKSKTVEVSEDMLTGLHRRMLELEKQAETQDGIIAGLKEVNESKDDGVKLREKKSYEPKFRTARLRKYPVAGNFDDQDYIIGWSDRGATDRDWETLLPIVTGKHPDRS